MRWDGQSVTTAGGDALPGLALANLVRSVRTPEFAGVTFHEVLCRSALNKVPAASQMPFRWTVNAVRGCLHACTYCFARPTHEYLDLGAGRDFETQLVVKTNVVDVLRAELARPSWRREHVAMGTNTDPYQRVEGRYQFMPGIVDALVRHRTPLSILTKGTLLRRDLPLLAEAAREVRVGIGVSLAVVDPELQAELEPGTPAPRARLELIRAVRDAGLPCGVMVAPVLPWLTDGREHLDALLRALADAGATGVTVLPLHLRGSVKPLFLGWLARYRPDLVPRYQDLYGTGAYAPAAYGRWLHDRVTPLLQRHGFADPSGHRAGRGAAPGEGAYPVGSLPAPGPEVTVPGVAQPTLF
ncbi:Rv2578c family radical SAM protein [Cellulomonas fimi]|uniref:Radical SAM domain protein n=1 Tax=Cellulomonas fimi (strain ATCC 484 / DSM 20113 / JCM 1341 / CCUG 24087 / LMG 16345 / NBRC 15513 / NCIMB 8980 / NCTC 7547 / NRS-133) TaxID=590998 RepID=F4H0A2_CELFA|nr:Rv2578c family radical SAM protein [Cellulomonas fimi]AEE46149.1 Radical SAM domain protein [Cellulomonas fimi ATCC 484]NNH07064.1 radical SAM protein [Cellulomonas fimi]VEH31828.1 Radical SAM superfamily [Cellulomonas fimi]